MNKAPCRKNKKSQKPANYQDYSNNVKHSCKFKMIKIQFPFLLLYFTDTMPKMLEPRVRNQLSDLCSLVYIIYPMAWSRSAIRSSASSIPTLNLINESANPFLILSSLGIEACVIDAG